MADEKAGSGWFESVPPDDPDVAHDVTEDGSADAPTDWPALAVDAGFVSDEVDYYDTLHEATVRTTREAVRERGRADDHVLPARYRDGGAGRGNAASRTRGASSSRRRTRVPRECIC